jgi:group I intron endonuclease
MIIYKAENLINGKVYIGKTSYDLAKRQWGHFNSAKKGSKTVFHCAIRKYGEENFEFSVLDYCASTEEMNEREKFYIKSLCSKVPYGYNLTFGGDGNDGSLKPNLGLKMAEETKQKIREKRRFQIFTDETKKKMSDSRKGKPHPHSATFKGKKHTKETKKRIGDSTRGSNNHNYGKPNWNSGLTKDSDPRLCKQAEKVSGLPAWNKGLTKDMDERVKAYAQTLKASSNNTLFKKGQKPWNLGISTVHSQESNLKRSNTMRLKGKKSKETVEKMRLAQRKRRQQEKNVLQMKAA